jgi:hypothetical protein
MALSVLSCTKTEISDSYKELNEIKFEGFKMGNSIGSQGKAAYAATNETFGVYASYNTVAAGPISAYLTNEELRYDGSNWVLGTGTKYYPSDMEEMHFIAYGVDYTKVKNKPSAIGNTTGNIPTLSYTAYDVTDQSDPALFDDFAITTSEVTILKTTKANPIVLNFTHALSRLKFEAKVDSDTPGEITANIKEIRVVSSNVADLAYNGVSKAYEWNSHTPSTSKTLTLNGNEADLTSNAVDIVNNAYLYIIPNQDVTIEVDYELTQKFSGTPVVIKSETAELDVLTTDNVFLMNNSVTYTLTVSKSLDPIIFGTPTIVDWTPTTATGSM